MFSSIQYIVQILLKIYHNQSMNQSIHNYTLQPVLGLANTVDTARYIHRLPKVKGKKQTKPREVN